MSGALKFAGFALGDKIRARDFEDRPGRGPCYVEGRVVEVNPEGVLGAPHAHYLIDIERQVWGGVEERDPLRGIGGRVRVPFGTFMDFEGRVELVAPAVLTPAAAPHVCTCCGEETETGRDCCTDDFREPGELRELA